MKTTPTSLAIRVITTGFLLLILGVLLGPLKDPHRWILGGALGVVLILCYLFAPIGYEVSDHRLTVLSRAGKKRFGSVFRCSRPTRRAFAIRLFGNGGLFAGTGIFWSRSYGVFRAYVTSARLSDMVLVETADHKILISPEDPDRFIALCSPASGQKGDPREC